MASPIEEDFVYNDIKKLSVPRKILEFGCGDNLFTNKISDLGHDVIAIDLYKRNSPINFNFIQSDFLYIDLPKNYYDVIYALSSFEHIGLEQDGILPENKILEKINLIVDKIKSILKNNGTLLITLPFGDYRYFYVNKDGWSYKKQNDSIWGAKIYTLDDINSIFRGFVLIKSEFYLRKGYDFFDRHSWILDSPENCIVKKEIADAIVCLQFSNR